jgi:hypothetical protein
MRDGYSKMIMILSGIGGAFLVAVSLYTNNRLLGINQFPLYSYIIPFICGGCMGYLIGYFWRKTKQLNDALTRHFSKMEKLLPICAFCKRIRLEGYNPYDQDSWQKIEDYISSVTDTKFTHSLCPECTKKMYPELFKDE